jgi:nitronate monooxygenase
LNFPTLNIGGLKPKIPIIQGGMAVRISLAPLAAAVAEEGGIGVIGASGMKPPELKEQIKQAKKMTKGIVGVNIMFAVKEFPHLLKTSIEQKIDVVISGAGFSRDAFKICKESNTPFMPIVSSPKFAVLAERLGASAIVVEGKEAGGHLGTDKSIFKILPEVVKSVKSAPVIAAGSIFNGGDIYKAICQYGAKGVQMATRFAVAEESSADIKWKKAYINAKPEDVTFVKSPVGLTGRAIRNEFSLNLFKQKKIKSCVVCLKDCGRDYCIIEALSNAQQGNLKEGLIFCGERVAEISKIEKVSEIMGHLKEEFKQAYNDNFKQCPKELLSQV